MIHTSIRLINSPRIIVSQDSVQTFSKPTLFNSFLVNPSTINQEINYSRINTMSTTKTNLKKSKL